MRLILVVLLAGCASGPVKTIFTLDETIAQARASGKPLLIDFSVAWCGPCKVVDRWVISDAKVKEALKLVNFVRYDAEKGAGVEAAKRLNVSAYPTFVLLDGSGLELDRFNFPGDPAPLAEWLKKTGDLVLTKAKLEARLAAHPENAQVALGAARWHVAHGNVDESMRLYEKARALDVSPGHNVAASAEWEGKKLARISGLRKQLAADARETLHKYPGTPEANRALAIALFVGTTDEKQAEDLLSNQANAVKDDAALLADLADMAAAKKLAALARSLADRTISVDPSCRRMSDMAYVLRDLDRPHAREILTRALPLAQTKGERLRVKLEMSTTKKSRSWSESKMQRYLMEIEGTRPAADGVDLTLARAPR